MGVIGSALGKILSSTISAATPTRAVKPLLIIGGIILIVVAAAVGKWAYDRALVRQHDATVNLDAARAGRAADANAAGQRQIDTTRAAAEAAELQKVIHDATDPDLGRRAYYRCVREQQSARANGERPPACQ